ncbi:DUF4145 domain-containing protein [Vibrio parahaemolyticus]|uniref:DUF4145 domain-containing protein n=1 Tax=Vibrio parahaemolyticus TaxID=670 RepID=UPI0013024F4C|nr:DUF4145 domain-containing protein [Vibrio parahaemolyticus]MBD6946037.1 DUF4145 domain-containing protein [Vibrio parahaemolyticus]MBD6957950.1 DUF4145 domain-containing protein [Vibrio parahaemolyticus]MBD6975966.1 DUF4145 domain-containing protein [Vibrio parahaemolyticus]WOZ60494.1 DUF4145 domain-containing protein [Vibrio parahaemolyticus]
MATLIRTCPHCNSVSMTFEAFGELLTGSYDRGGKHFLVPLMCNGCNGGLFAEVKYNWGPTPYNIMGTIDSNPEACEVLEVYPEAQEPEAPEHVPSNIASFYVQAEKSLHQNSFDASAMMSRKALEVATKTLDPDGSGSLYRRVEKLYDDNLITVSLKEWAHIIREDGNVAAHEIDPVDEKHAQELIDFCELFLMYTFTMPQMIADKKNV